MPSREPKVWRIYVREGDRGEDYADKAVRGKYVALGGTDAGAVTSFTSKQDFLARFRKEYGDGSVKRAREVWRLNEQSSALDWVLMPSRNERRVHIGQMNSKGYFLTRRNDGCRFGHRWHVDWHGHASYEDARDVCGLAVLGPGALVSIDVPYAAIAELLARATSVQVEPRSEALARQPVEGDSLAPRDADDIEAVYRARVVTVCRLHNAMTNRVRDLCASRYAAREGSTPECLYDALIENYDGDGRDLLVEVKSTLDRGSLRLAVGQLLDYRRGVPRPDETDLAVLLPTAPGPDAVAFLRDVGVKLLWFSDENLSAVAGGWTMSPV